uniref:Potassium channel domain-containing protein n=1 Tax=Ciona intestinalis TaxID=7719 RepID=F6QGJ9_CIOIN
MTMSVSGSLENIADHEDEAEKKWRPTLKGNLIILGLLVVYLLFNLLGAYIFVIIERQPSVSKVNWFTELKDHFVSNEEGWSYIECLYTVFITLTTVGFGDFVPDPSSHGGMYTTLLVTIWVIAGLAWFATIFSLIATIMSARAKSFRRTMTTKKTNIINRVKRKNVNPGKSSLSTKIHTEGNIGDY